MGGVGAIQESWLLKPCILSECTHIKLWASWNIHVITPYVLYDSEAGEHLQNQSTDAAICSPTHPT